ncbi:MAG: hypothetical protein LBM09_02575 [Candidatus Nomurabacteria bacterium]|jgi:hypothetical protein|nr:hypothetical protein [Candidatus Nomurabacteria bacterium]
MAKNQKKRNKKYTGVNAKPSTNTVRVHKVNAVVRSKSGQWAHEHRKLIKRVGIAVLIVGVIVFLIVNSIMTSK